MYWKNEKLIYDSAGVTSADYVEILKGNAFSNKVNEHSHNSGKPSRHINGALSIDFEDVRLKQKDTIVGGDFITNNQNSTIQFGRNDALNLSLEGMPFHIGYQSSDETCFTRNSSYEPNIVRREDSIFFADLPRIDQNLEMRVIVHYPGPVSYTHLTLPKNREV